MREYRIRGGNRLEGELAVGGAKNAVLPILAAAYLNESETIITNCPRISDTFNTVEILRGLGCEVGFSGNTIRILPASKPTCEVPAALAKKMRSSILFMGALLARNGCAELVAPGGCKLGERAINLHIDGLTAMGARICFEKAGDECKIFCEASNLHGANIRLDFPSVGATENLLIAAARAKGETVIENAAREPEVADLAEFLKKSGVKIRGAGTPTIVVQGSPHQNETVTHEVLPDRIVAGTFLVAAAMTRGEIRLTGVRPFDLAPFTAHLAEMGCVLRAEDSAVTLRAPERLRGGVRIVTRVHPGFPTDMQSQFAAALSVADRRSEITETIFEGRSSHVSELRKMGAGIHLTANKRTFEIDGLSKLRGTTVVARDLRCGAALILAGLVAEGETIVQNAEYVERGYENIERDSSVLGADIKKICVD